jgi:co-chaperonin GroES (HSP10)
MRILYDRVLVKPIKEANTTSGIILTEGSQKKNKGEIVIIGTKVTHLKVGDIVLYHDHVGIGIDYNGIHHLLLREGDKKIPGEIIAIIG